MIVDRFLTASDQFSDEKGRVAIGSLNKDFGFCLIDLAHYSVGASFLWAEIYLDPCTGEMDQICWIGYVMDGQEKQADNCSDICDLLF